VPDVPGASRNWPMISTNHDFPRSFQWKLSADEDPLALAKARDSRSQNCFLLDEPTASLDPDNGDWVAASIVQDYRKTHGATILLASHNMLESSACATASSS
jgi:ABC-2 type transport system ATP-binding protein